MKKHFIKVKQFADNVGRTEKKEVLSKDLASVEKRVKLLEQTCSATYKKLVSLQGAPGTQDVEKRRRKQLTEAQMSAQFLENRSLLDDGGSVGGGGTLALMYRLCGDAYATLAEGATVAQTTLEDDVLVPLNNVVENDFPNVMKLKKQLEKMTAELDVLKQKWQTSVRQSAQVGSSGIAAHAAKVEQTKAEMDDLLLKTEQCKDFLATELYRLCSKEAEFGQLLIELVEIQRQCHRDALTCLDELLPALHSQRDLFRLKPVYGVTLDDHLRATDRDVAEVLEDCICSILDLGLEEEGLFRVAGSKTKIKKLTAEFDVGSPDLTEYDIHCITGALKQYLRALPEPLMTFDLYDDWMEATRVDDLDSKLQALWIVCSKLPKTYYTNLRYLVKFLAKLVTHSQTNKMTPTNVAIVFGPNLIYPKGDDGMNVFMSAQQSSIIETLVQHADWFFPGDVDYKPYMLPTRSNSLSSQDSATRCSNGGALFLPPSPFGRSEHSSPESSSPGSPAETPSPTKSNRDPYSTFLKLLPARFQEGGPPLAASSERSRSMPFLDLKLPRSRSGALDIVKVSKRSSKKSSSKSLSPTVIYHPHLDQSPPATTTLNEPGLARAPASRQLRHRSIGSLENIQEDLDRRRGDGGGGGGRGKPQRAHSIDNLLAAENEHCSRLSLPPDEEFKVTADGVKVASPFMLSHLTSDDALSLASTDLRRRNQSHDLLNVTATPPSRHEAPDNISLTSSSRCASQDSLSSLLTPGESLKQEGRRRKRHAPPVPIETAVVVPMETVTEPNSFVDRENKTNGECVRPSSIEAEKSPILAKERPVPPQRSSSYTPPTNSNRRPSGPPPGKPPPPTAAARLHKPDVIPGNDAAVRGQRLPAEKVPPPVPTKPALDRRAFTPARSPSVEVAPKKHSVTSDPILSPSADTRKVESNAIPTRRSGKKFTDHRRNDDDEEVLVNNGGKPTEHIYAVLDANTSVRVPSPGGVDADATSNGKDCVPSVPPVFEPPGGRLANLQESASDRPALSPPPVPVQGNDNPRPVTREDEDDEHSTWF